MHHLRWDQSCRASFSNYGRRIFKARKSDSCSVDFGCEAPRFLRIGNGGAAKRGAAIVPLSTIEPDMEIQQQLSGCLQNQ